jgi:DNA invertase Pin-like site-specific DNA recombinase
MGSNNLGVAILRISSLRQRDGYSHDVQEAEITQYARAAGIKLVRVERLTESAKSSEDRKKYQSVIKWAIAENIQHVLFYQVDREARNLTDNEYNEKLVRAGIITLHYTHDRRVISQSSPDTEFFLRDMQATMNKNLSRVIGVKTKAAMIHKAELGWAPTNHLPLGYRHERIRDNHGREQKRGTTIVVDPVGAAQVRREFELRASGLSFRGIRDAMIREGFIPVDSIRNYHVGSIERRLSNPFYRGEFTFAGVTYQGKHELIIPDETMAIVQSMAGRRAESKSPMGVFAGGKITCSECGCYVVFDRKFKTLSTGEKKEFRYYRCSNGKGLHASRKRGHISEEKIWASFLPLIDSLTLGAGIASQALKELRDDQRAQRAAHKKLVADLELMLKRIDSDLDRAYEDFRSQVIDREIFERQKAKLQTKKQETLRAFSRASIDKVDQAEKAALSTIELLKSAKSLWQSRSDAERLDFVLSLVSNLKLDGVTIRYDLKKPFEILSGVTTGEEWRTQRDNYRTAFLALAA